MRRRARTDANRATPESAVLRSCLDYLRLASIPAWRINTQGVPLHDGSGGFRRAPSVGLPDIIGIATTIVGGGSIGHFEPVPLAVECKSAKGKQTAGQLEFERAWIEASGLYVLCRSASELREALIAARVRIERAE